MVGQTDKKQAYRRIKLYQLDTILGNAQHPRGGPDFAHTIRKLTFRMVSFAMVQTFPLQNAWSWRPQCYRCVCMGLLLRGECLAV